ncbi:PHP domain-containing protein [Saccharothrix obliqua]|uniref:PHP domain-containing protein n=1 Tax=Saccharothrix obliqua TaxID=2861747 RepID=UPI001C5DE630|nr:PHP domain-containing protein [Saccharothrix obliqua]MBW4719311.1 PHP domain-containing protein [Saccharothrix obliqua]
MRIDLHTHSTESDGTDTPAELVAAAAASGLSAVALTDHDTAAGWAEAAEALPPGLRLVRGAELSCASDDGRGRVITVHLLAYLYDPTSPALVEEQLRLRSERRHRLRRMAHRMVEDGFPIDPDELMASMPPDAPAGRPHLAMALIRAGVVTSVDEAFARYLTGGRYYVPRTDTPVERAIAMIADAGGVTVLAHPFASVRGPIVSDHVVADLAELGLGGVEVDHPDHDAATRDRLRGLAGELGLLVTGSSDYHGTNKTVRLGAETTSPDVLDAIADRATGSKVLGG